MYDFRKTYKNLKKNNNMYVSVKMKLLSEFISKCDHLS